VAAVARVAGALPDAVLVADAGLERVAILEGRALAFSLSLMVVVRVVLVMRRIYNGKERRQTRSTKTLIQRKGGLAGMLEAMLRNRR
jgi:hypothetical protein